MQKHVVYGQKSLVEKAIVSRLFMIVKDYDRLARSERIKRGLQAKKVVEKVS